MLDVDELLLLPERKLNDWRLFDAVEPIGTRESRQQLAILNARIFNAYRARGTLPKEMEDFLLQTVESDQTRQMERMLGMLGAVAIPRPAGYKRKRPRQPK